MSPCSPTRSSGTSSARAVAIPGVSRAFRPRLSVPDLTVRADGQRNAFVRADEEYRVIRYEATDGSFAADITLDRDGIVIDYPGIARRLFQTPA